MVFKIRNLSKLEKLGVSLTLAVILTLAQAVWTQLLHNPLSGPELEVSISPTAAPSNTTKQLYQVIDVVDGDTVKVSIEGKTEIIRLIGLDTPETLDPRKAVQCFGREASNKAKELLNGKMIALEADYTQGERDKYQRLLRYFYLEDGTLFNKQMIGEGYAHEYTYNSNPYTYQAEFKAAEKEAREAKRGLWSDTTCNGDTTKAAIPPTTPSPAQTSTDSIDYDCKDFATEAEAQAYFDAQGGSASINIDRLDGSDHDSLVCEANP